MNEEEILRNAITKVKEHGYVPKNGPVVVKAYNQQDLNDMETCLYVIAELLDVIMIEHEKVSS